MSADEIRDLLAEALHLNFGDVDELAQADWRYEAETLLPTVRRIVADELREAADAEAKHHSVPAADRLRDRAWHIEGGQP